MSYELSYIAELIAAADNREPGGVHLQLRNPRVRTMLEPIERPGRAATAAHRYREKELARARIFVALLDFGLDHRALETVNRALTRQTELGYGPDSHVLHPEWARSPGGGGHNYGDALDSLMKAARAEDDWIITVRFTRDEKGERIATPSIGSARRFKSERADRLRDLSQSETYLGHLSIPAAELIRGVLES